MSLIPLVLLTSALAAPPEKRGCDRRDGAAVKAYNDAVAAEAAGDLSAARRLVGTVLVTQPDCLVALELAGRLATHGVGDEGADAIERGLRLYADTSSSGKLAALAFQEGNYADAERLFTEELKVDRSNAWAKMGRAACLVHLERREESITLFRELLDAEAWVTVEGGGRVSGVVPGGAEVELESALARSASLLVQLLVGEGRHEEAAATLARVEARFGRVPALIGGRIAVETGTLGAGAWATADPALERHPDDPGILEPTGLLAFRHPEGLNPANLAILARAKGGSVRFNTLAGLARSGRDAECLTFAALAREGLEASSVVPFRSVAYLCAAKTREIAALEAYYDVADPRVNGWSVAMHAALLFEAGRTGEATALASRALELKDGARPGTIVLGKLALKAGDFEEVVRLATADRSDGVATLTLATELAALKRVDEARRASARLRCSQLEDLRAPCAAFLATLKTAR